MAEIATRRDAAGTKNAFLVAYQDHLLRELAEVRRRLDASSTRETELARGASAGLEN